MDREEAKVTISELAQMINTAEGEFWIAVDFDATEGADEENE